MRKIKPPFFKSGDSIGRLTLVQVYRKTYGVKRQVQFWVWKCKCECETLCHVREDHLRSERIKSCGCLNDELRGSSQIKHGESWSRTAEYSTWSCLKSRCFNKNNSHYRWYGGRGIRVCDRWLGEKGFQNFLQDMGRRPSSKHSIDRIDNDGNYEPSNCRWVTDCEQKRNTSVAKRLTFQGETRLLVEWAEIVGISASTIHNRLYSGWSVDDALTISTTDAWAHRRRRFVNNGRGW